MHRLVQRWHSLSPAIRAHAVALIVLALSLLILLPAWLVLMAYFYLADGGTLGGYGAAPEPGRGTTFDNAALAANLFILAAAIAAYFLTYKRVVRSLKGK